MFKKIKNIIRGDRSRKSHKSKGKIIFLIILTLMLILLFLGFYHHRRPDGSVIVERMGNPSHCQEYKIMFSYNLSFQQKASSHRPIIKQVPIDSRRGPLSQLQVLWGRISVQTL